VRIALHVVGFDAAAAAIPATLDDVSAICDEGGVAALSVMDHWFGVEAMGMPVTDPMLEGYSTLAYLAARTRRVGLRLLVSGVTYRHPGRLAKTVTPLDVLSAGRAQLGIGAAWFEREHLGLGVPFPPLAERFERLEEALQICLQMWSDDDGPYAGTHYRLAETICSPAPLTSPHPPIVVGGNGERKTLRLVARYGDACNLMVMGADDTAPRLDALRAHCEREDRDPAAITRTVTFVADPFADLDTFLRTIDALAALGVDEVVVMAGTDARAVAERVVREIVPRVTGL
jgi:F420-dependent oxidoreductase-like protein